jgi:Sulfotransferase family
MSNKILPNFLIVGAAKSGTTSLYKYLLRHPEIYLNEQVKETFFLTGLDFMDINHDGGHYGHGIITDTEKYNDLFKDVNNEKAVGEVCVGYLYFYKESIPIIKTYLSDPKIIIILRNPIDRAFSNYMHHVRDGNEFSSFEEALEKETEREKMNYWWGYFFRKAGLYSEQIHAYRSNFSNVKIYLFEELQNNPELLLKDIFEFLDVDSTFFSENLYEKYNVTGIPNNNSLNNFLTQTDKFIPEIIRKGFKTFISDDLLNRVKNNLINENLKKESMKPETRSYLQEYFRNDILKVQNIINRDLSKWLQ